MKNIYDKINDMDFEIEKIELNDFNYWNFVYYNFL